jgi:hypothetical protein
VVEAVGRRMEEERLRVAWVRGLIFVCVCVCVFVGVCRRRVRVRVSGRGGFCCACVCVCVCVSMYLGSSGGSREKGDVASGVCMSKKLEGR